MKKIICKEYTAALILFIVGTCFVAGITSFVNSKDVFDDPIVIKSIDPLIKVTHDLSSSTAETLVYDVAKNEDVNVQFVVWNNLAVNNLNAQVVQSPVKINYTVRKVDYVTLKLQATAVNNRLHPSDGNYPDPLTDINASVNLQPNAVTAIWLTIHVPDNIAAGTMNVPVIFTATVNNKSTSIRKNVQLKVHGATVDRNNFPWYSNWLFIDVPTLGPSVKKLKYINNNTDIPVFTDAYWNAIDRIASFMGKEGQNVVLLAPDRLADFSYKGDSLLIDFSRFNKMVDIFSKQKVIGRIEGQHLCGRPGGWVSNFVVHYVKKAANGTAVFADGNPDDPAVQQYYKVYLTALIADLKKMNIFDKYYQHIGDEPIDENAASYLSALNMIKKIAPSLKTIDAIQTTKVADKITIPVPQLDFFARNRDYFLNLINAGKEVWVYTSWQPQGSYANRFIEQQALQHRLLFWILAKYNIKGALSWAFNYWENPDVYNQLGKPAGQQVMPAGDSYLVYPKTGGLISSIRMETLKDGLEDYALLQKLKQQNPQLAVKLIDNVVQNASKYTTDVDAFRNVQKQLLNSIH